MIPPGSSPNGSTALGSVSTLTGAVSSAGTGDDAGCFRRDAVGWGYEDVSDAWWITLPDDQRGDWQFGVWFPDGPAGPAVGDVVTADFAFEFGGFAPTIAHLDLRDDAGALIAWIGVGATVSDLPIPPGLSSLEQGPVAGHEDGECFPWTSYDLLVDGVDVAYGDIARVNGLEVRHGGIDLQDTGTTVCPDAYMAWAAVGVLP